MLSLDITFKQATVYKQTTQNATDSGTDLALIRAWPGTLVHNLLVGVCVCVWLNSRDSVLQRCNVSWKKPHLRKSKQ